MVTLDITGITRSIMARGYAIISGLDREMVDVPVVMQRIIQMTREELSCVNCVFILYAYTDCTDRIVLATDTFAGMLDDLGLSLSDVDETNLFEVTDENIDGSN